MDVLDIYRSDVKAKGGKRMEEIASATGLKLGTLRNIYYIPTMEPGHFKVEALRKFYKDTGYAT